MQDNMNEEGMIDPIDTVDVEPEEPEIKSDWLKKYLLWEIFLGGLLIGFGVGALLMRHQAIQVIDSCQNIISNCLLWS